MKKQTYMERMSYESFEYALKVAHERTGKNRIVLGFDMFKSNLLYGSDFIDYIMLGFYELKRKEKKTYVTHEKNDDLVKKYNDKKYIPLIEDRQLFNEKFYDYLKRDSFHIDGDNYDDFVTFLKDKKEIYIKPRNKNGKYKIERVKFGKYKNLKALYRHLKERRFYVIEEALNVHPVLKKLASDDYVSVHITTLFKNDDSFLINSFLKLEGKHTMVAPIDLDSGVVLDDACDSDLSVYEKYPTTNEKIEGTKIPHFEQAKEMILKAAKELPRLRYIDWNILISESGPALMSATVTPNYSFYQFPHHTHHTGMLPIIEEIEK